MDQFLSTTGEMKPYAAQSMDRWAQDNGYGSQFCSEGNFQQEEERRNGSDGIPVVAIFGGGADSSSGSEGVSLRMLPPSQQKPSGGNKKKAQPQNPLVLNCSGLNPFTEAVVAHISSHVILQFGSDDDLLRYLSKSTSTESEGGATSMLDIGSPSSRQLLGGVGGQYNHHHQNGSSTNNQGGTSSSSKLLCDSPFFGANAANTNFTVVVNNALLEHSSTVSSAVKERFPSARIVRLRGDQQGNAAAAGYHNSSASVISTTGGGNNAGTNGDSALKATIEDLIDSSPVKRLRPELPPLSPRQWYLLCQTLLQHGHKKTLSSCVKKVVENELESASEQAEHCYQEKMDANFGSKILAASSTANNSSAIYNTKALLAYHNEVKSEVLSDFRSRLAPFGAIDCEDVLGRLQTNLQKVKHQMKIAAQAKSEAVITELLEPLTSMLLAGGGGSGGGLDAATLTTWQEAIVDIIKRYHDTLGGEGSSGTRSSEAAVGVVPPSSGSNSGVGLGVDASVRNSVLLDVLLQWYIPNTTVVHNAAQEKLLTANQKLQKQNQDLTRKTEQDAAVIADLRAQLDSEINARAQLSAETEKLTGGTLRKIELLRSSVETTQNVVTTALRTIVADKFEEANAGYTSSSTPAGLNGGDSSSSNTTQMVSSARHQVLLDTEKHLGEMLANCFQLQNTFLDSQRFMSAHLQQQQSNTTNTSLNNSIGVVNATNTNASRLSLGAAAAPVPASASSSRGGVDSRREMNRPSMQTTEELSLVHADTDNNGGARGGGGSSDASFWRSDAQLTGVVLSSVGSNSTSHQDLMLLKDQLLACEQAKDLALKRAEEAKAAQQAEEDQLAETKLRLRDLEKDCTQLKNRYEELHSQYTDVCAEASELAPFKQQYHDTHGELVTVKAREAMIASTLSEVEGERDRLTNELAHVTAERDELERNHQELSEQHDHHVELLAETEKDLRQAKSSVETLTNDVRMLTTDLETSRQEHTRVAVQCDEAQHTCTDLLAQLRQERAERDEGNQRYETQISDLLQKKDAAEADFNSMYSELTQHKTLVQNLKEEVVTKQETNERLQKEGLVIRTEAERLTELLGQKQALLAQREGETQQLRMQHSQANEAATSWKSRYDSIQQELAASREHEYSMRLHSEKLQSRLLETKHITEVAPKSILHAKHHHRYASPSRTGGSVHNTSLQHTISAASAPAPAAVGSASYHNMSSQSLGSIPPPPQAAHQQSSLLMNSSAPIVPSTIHSSPQGRTSTAVVGGHHRSVSTGNLSSNNGAGGRLQPRPIDPHVKAIEELDSNVSRIRSNASNASNQQVIAAASSSAPAPAPVTLGELQMS